MNAQNEILEFSRRANQTIVSPIKLMALYAEGIENTVSLGWGMPSFETPVHIREAAKTALDVDMEIGKYPSIRGLPMLRELVSKRIDSRYRRKFSPNNEILITVGAQQAIFTSLMCLLNEGDEVIYFTPGFPSYRDQILFCSGKPIEIQMNEGSEWSIDISSIEYSISSKRKQ